MTKETSIQTLQSGFRLQSNERIYEIVKVLGSGSFGITYLATAKVSVGNISTTMKFAIKEHFVSASCYRGYDGATVLTVPTAKSEVSDSRADFITEANRLQKLCLKSRNIVSVNETFEANGTAYYVMEFLDGGNPSRSSEEKAISIVMQVADALNEIHKERVLHLDLKPDNIVLKTNDRNETYPVLIDFGISKHFDSKGRPTSSLSAKGASSGFAPQEQYAGVSEFSPKYDIYALGAVLFFLCTGKNPPDAFKISPNQQELIKALDGKVSSKIEKTILNAMKPSASERTPSIKQFCDDLMGIDFVPVLNISDSQINFNKNKEQKNILVDSNISWSVYSEEDWCTVKKTDNSVIISVTNNKETSGRFCNVVVNGTSHKISQVIHIKQEGVGTIVFSSGPTWWERNGRKVYQAGGVILIGCCLVGMFEILKPNPEKESKRLTEAITSMDGDVLEQFAKEDSVRAYLPLAKYLVDKKDFENAQKYANKAMMTSDSTKAKTLLNTVNTALTTNTNTVLTPVGHMAEKTDEEKPQKEQEINNPSNSPQEPVTESNDAKFIRAQDNFTLMLSLAQDNYAKAYYPLAKMYFNRKDNNNAKRWAQRAVNANVNRKDAQQLLKKIDTPDSSNDELFAKATTIADFKALADKGYAKAYAPLADKYFTDSKYSEANIYARRALSTKVGRTQAIAVIEKLSLIGFYDNGENGGKPKY